MSFILQIAPLPVAAQFLHTDARPAHHRIRLGLFRLHIDALDEPGRQLRAGLHAVALVLREEAAVRGRGAEQQPAHRFRCGLRSSSDQYCYWCVRSPRGTRSPQCGLRTVLLGRCWAAAAALAYGADGRGVRWRAQETLCGRIRDLRFASRLNPHLPKIGCRPCVFRAVRITRGHAHTARRYDKYSDPGQPAPSDRHAIDAHHGARQSAHLRREARRGARVGDAAPGGWKLADIVDGALEGAVATSLDGAPPPRRRRPPELLGASAARHVGRGPGCCTAPRRAARTQRRAARLRPERQEALAAKLGTDEKGRARAALAGPGGLRAPRCPLHERRRERPKHVRSLLELVDGAGFRAGWGVA